MSRGLRRALKGARLIPLRAITASYIHPSYAPPPILSDKSHSRTEWDRVASRA